MHAIAPPPIPLPLLVDSLEPLIEGLQLHPQQNQLNWMRGLGMWQLRRLWKLAEAYPETLTVEDVVPEGVDEPVVCHGKNHLPIFARFAKVFARVDGEVVGYNETYWEKLWVGPGHFRLVPNPEIEGELLVDYRTLPERTHPSFPALASNERLFGWPGPFARLAYGAGMTDRLRRVGGSLLIGCSVTPGLSLQSGAFFALCLPDREG